MISLIDGCDKCSMTKGGLNTWEGCFEKCSVKELCNHKLVIMAHMIYLINCFFNTSSLIASPLTINDKQVKNIKRLH